MTETRSNAFRYRHLLKRPAEGICLWYPSDDAAIGDVGYVYEGAFNAVSTGPCGGDLYQSSR